MHGATLHILGEGWKELKVGGLGTIELQPMRDPVTGDILDLPHTVENTYVAHLGGPEVFGQQCGPKPKRAACDECRVARVFARARCDRHWSS